MDVNKTKSDQLHIDYDVFLYKANELNKYELSPLVAKLQNVIHFKKKKVWGESYFTILIYQNRTVSLLLL